MTRRPKQIETDQGPVPRFTDIEYLLLVKLIPYGSDGTYMADWANQCGQDGSAFFRAVSRLSGMGMIETTGIIDRSPNNNKRVYRCVSGTGQHAFDVNDALRTTGKLLPPKVATDSPGVMF